MREWQATWSWWHMWWSGKMGIPWLSAQGPRVGHKKVAYILLKLAFRCKRKKRLTKMEGELLVFSWWQRCQSRRILIPEPLSPSSTVRSKCRLFFFKGITEDFRSPSNNSVSCQQWFRVISKRVPVWNQDIPGSAASGDGVVRLRGGVESLSNSGEGRRFSDTWDDISDML
jgi:hypothetical protein